MIIISGPSTIGKNPLIYQICNKFGYFYNIPWTTRNMRREEKNGVDYYFTSKKTFQQKIKQQEITNWDYCLKNYYGFTPFDLSNSNIITHSLSRMAIRIKQHYPSEITTIFLMPKQKDVIFQRLKELYNGEDFFLRLQLVEEEITHACLFDYNYVINYHSNELLDNKQFVRLLIGK